MRILVYGAGVIGCELAHELCIGGNSVTILARGKWKESIDKHGLVIRHYGQLCTTVDCINTIEKLSDDDKYDLIFVVMQYSQVMAVIPQLARNISRNIVLVGNNMSPEYCKEQIYKQSSSDKEVAFGFQGTGGRREEEKVISMHFKVSMTVGGLKENLSTQFQNKIVEAFQKTAYELKWEQHMQGWLLSHAAHILPTAYVCYSLNCNLKCASREQAKLAVAATSEAHEMLKKLGYPICPSKEEKAYTEKSKKKQFMLYLMFKTPVGKFVISNHCANAVGEMTSLDEQFEKLRDSTGMTMPAWDKLRKEAMTALGSS